MIGRLFKRSEPLGEVPVPGEATLVLPAGKVSVRYEEDREGRSGRPGDGMPFGRSPELDVTARRAGEVIPSPSSGRAAPRAARAATRSGRRWASSRYRPRGTTS